MAWPAAELCLTLAAAALSLAFVHVLLVAANFHAQNEVARGLGPVWAAAMILVAVAAQVAQRRGIDALRSRALVALLAGVATGFVTAPLTAGLRGTDQPLNTILGGDMAFRTEYVTRFASTWHLHDYTFKGLGAFYPPAWFWVAGRAAHVLGLNEPWHIVKPFTIATIGGALLLAYLLWRMVLSPAGALSAAIGSSLVLSSQVGRLEFATTSWYSPYSAFVAVTGVAWLAATLVTLRAPDGRRARLVLLGVVGAALALCYYLLFIILALVLLVLAALPSLERRGTLLRAAALLAGIGLLTAVFWVPLIQALVHGAASQGQFVRPDFLRVSLGVVGGPLALSLLAVVAIAALALTFASPGSQAVAALIGGTIVYQLISVATLVFANNQLQPHRAVTMMWATYGAALPVALDGYRRGGGLGQLMPSALPRVLAVVALAVAIPATFALGSEQGADLAGGPFAVAAHDRPELSQTRAISSFITRASGKRPQELTIVAGDHAVLVTEPYYGFLPLRARYAHPEAHLAQRIEVLRAAARCPDPACTTRALSHSRFGPIDALVLARTFPGFRVETQEDRFPEPQPITVHFSPGSFDPAVWMRRNFGGYAVFVRRPGPLI
jgi:galactan 5-O-arabinofuranosyltransferase